jgi:hypothetical protein
MKAIFKEKKKLVLNSADSNEQLILEEFIKKCDSEKFSIVFTKLLDINGDISGMSIELVSKKETEPSTPTETVED